MWWRCASGRSPESDLASGEAGGPVPGDCGSRWGLCLCYGKVWRTPRERCGIGRVSPEGLRAHFRFSVTPERWLKGTSVAMDFPGPAGTSGSGRAGTGKAAEACSGRPGACKVHGKECRSDIELRVVFGPFPVFTKAVKTTQKAHWWKERSWIRPWRMPGRLLGRPWPSGRLSGRFRSLWRPSGCFCGPGGPERAGGTLRAGLRSRIGPQTGPENRFQEVAVVGGGSALSRWAWRMPWRHLKGLEGPETGVGEAAGTGPGLREAVRMASEAHRGRSGALECLGGIRTPGAAPGLQRGR